MVKIILYILLLSVLGIIAFFILLNSILHRIFHHSPVENKRTPDEVGLAYNELFIETVHHKKLQMFEVSAQKQGEVAFLCVHGWANTVDNFLELAARLVKFGPVYLLNTRNHGKSARENSMTILKYETDIRHAIDYIENKYEGKVKIVLLGHSLGGAAALLTASDDKRVAGVVSISTFSDMEKILRQGFVKSNLPEWFINGLLTYIEFRIGRSLKQVSPAWIVTKLDVPVLLIHGTKDEVVDYMEMEKIFKEAKKKQAEKFVAKGHNHSSLLKDENVSIAIESFIKKQFLNK
ncbi:alpha/beta hydrolase [Caldithrix abyssi]